MNDDYVKRPVKLTFVVIHSTCQFLCRHKYITELTITQQSTQHKASAFSVLTAPLLL